MGGFSRVLFSKGFSVIYVIIIARLVAKAIMDQIIILTVGHAIITQIAIFAMRYSCLQRALSTTGESSTKIIYNATIFMLTIAIPFSMVLALPVTYYVVRLEHPELFLTYPLYLALLIIKDTETIVERSLLAVDKAVFIDMIYSILSSILIPVFFYINPRLESVLWAWNVGLIITILLNIKSLVKPLRQRQFNKHTMRSLFRFGFPIYLTTLPVIVAKNLNNIVIYESFEEGATSIFYWPNRILSIASEILLIALTGSQELFTHLNAIDKVRLRDSFLAVFRSLTIISTVAFFLIFLNSSLLIQILLGSGYTQASHLFILLCFAWTITTIRFSMSFLKGAEGHRRVIAKVNMLNFCGKFILLLILVQFGLEGIVLAEILSAATIFLYYVKNTKFLKTNDNFIRLGIFVAIIIIISFLESLVTFNDLFSFVMINSFYLVIVSLSFLLIRPLTNRDITFFEKILPIKVIWMIKFYRPSRSRYD